MRKLEKLKKEETVMNKGFVARNGLIALSAPVKMFCPVILDTMFLPRVLPTQTEINLVFHRTDHKFCLQAKKDEYKLRVEGAKLYVPRMRLTDGALSYQNSLLNSGGIIYPTLRHDIRTTGIPKAGQNVDWSPFVGELPQRIYLFHCLQSAYNGEITKNPFNFELFNLKSLQVLMNGRSLPVNQPLVSDSDDFVNTFTDLYYMSHQGLEGATPMDPYNFGWGFGVIIIDLSRTQSAGCDYNDLPQNGNLRIVTSYKEGMKEPVILICIGEFRKNLKIDQDRNPAWT